MEPEPLFVYDRAVLVDVIVYHWRTNSSGCGCGWGVLGASYAEHVADVYEESVRVRHR
jgi:16S rRNA G1207 methylase RsmC